MEEPKENTRNNSKVSILNPYAFGISNGVSTILALLAGFYAAKTSRLSVIVALIALLITDPISDAHSIYVAMKDSNPEEAWLKFKGTFGYQLAVQAMFLLIVILIPSFPLAFGVSLVVGITLLLSDYIQRFRDPVAVMREFSGVSFLIFFTFVVDKMVARGFK